MNASRLSCTMCTRSRAPHSAKSGSKCCFACDPAATFTARLPMVQVRQQGAYGTRRTAPEARKDTLQQASWQDRRSRASPAALFACGIWHHCSSHRACGSRARTILHPGGYLARRPPCHAQTRPRTGLLRPVPRPGPRRMFVDTGALLQRGTTCSYTPHSHLTRMAACALLRPCKLRLRIRALV